MIPPIARRFVAGETPVEAVDHVHHVNDSGINAILNLLGESYTERELAAADTAAYCALLDDLAGTDANACISIKPTQVGLGVGQTVFRENALEIIHTAAANDQFVWLDMEHHTTTDDTIEVFETLRDAYPGGTGLCLQANLKRTPEDLERLVGEPGGIRLVKGAYCPPTDIAHRDRAVVNAAYEQLMERLFEHHTMRIGIATHDPRMIAYAKELGREYETPFEFQMLMGVRESTQETIAADYPVWQYIPYGDKWLSYFYRRLRERKENIWFALRAILGR